MRTAPAASREYVVERPCGAVLAVSEHGPEHAPAVVALHGLVGIGADMLAPKRLTEAGLRVIAYDARGHGASGSPGSPEAYTFAALTGDLAAVMDRAEADRATLAGVSMGALTALRLALHDPARVAALVVITPAYEPGAHPVAAALERGHRAAAALRARDLEAFVAAGPITADDPDAARALSVMMRRRFGSHRDLAALADAIDVVLDDPPFASLDDLALIDRPVRVVGSRDEFDLDHPYSVACVYARALNAGRVVCEQPGRVPLAWRADALSRIVLELASETGTLV